MFAMPCVESTLTPWTRADRTVPLYALTWCNGLTFTYHEGMTDDDSRVLLEQRLDDACAEHRRALQALREARVVRNAAVADARAGGLTWERIADHFGVVPTAPIAWMHRANCEGGHGHG